jgi:hypothetical protein
MKVQNNAEDGLVGGKVTIVIGFFFFVTEKMKK